MCCLLSKGFCRYGGNRKSSNGITGSCFGWGFRQTAVNLRCGPVVGAPSADDDGWVEGRGGLRPVQIRGPRPCICCICFCLSGQLSYLSIVQNNPLRPSPSPSVKLFSRSARNIFHRGLEPTLGGHGSSWVYIAAGSSSVVAEAFYAFPQSLQ